MLQLLTAAAILAATPATDLRAAMTDAQSLPPAIAYTTRYVSSYHIEPRERPVAAGLASLALNLVSRTSAIATPDIVPGTEGRLLRINLVNYGIPAKTWEAMVSAGEPYWHIRAEVIDPATKAKETIYTDGGWVGLGEAATLRNITQSGGAIVRSDWLFAKLITTLDGGLYYEFSGVTDFKDVNDLYTSLGIDFAATDRLQVESWAALIRRSPTQKPGRIIRRQGAAGGAWKTEDTLQQNPAEDPLRNPLSRGHDGSEHVIAKANGLPLFVLADAKGNFVKSAPDILATDDTLSHGNSILAPALSCVHCHREDFLRTVDDDLAKVLAGDVAAFFIRPEDAAKAASVFGRDMLRYMARDREDFAAAVAAATGGWTVEQVSEISAEVYRSYVHQSVTPERAIAELGLPQGTELKPVLGASHDVVILALCEGIPVQRKQWEASFGEAALIVAQIHR